MKIYSIEGNTERLDGGAMFGHAPKELWSKWIAPDSLNRIPLACRCLLLQTDNGKNILFETGIGAFFEPKLKDRYGVCESEHLLLKNLSSMEVRENDIDAIVLSHLHFDHAGGLLSPYDGGPSRLLFPKATYYVGKKHWDQALNAHPREQASYIPNLQTMLKESNRLKIIEGTSHADLPSITFSTVDGHTVGLMLSHLELPAGPLVFVADLIPGLPWIHLPIVMGYDRFPERVIDEKRDLLEKLLKMNGKVFFTHDPSTPYALIRKDTRGKFYGEPIEADRLSQ